MNQVLMILMIITLINLRNIDASDKKGCHFNDVLIHEEIFPYFACWKCYENFKTNRKLVKVNCRILRDEVFYSAPGFVVEDGCVPFDHRTKSIRELVQRSLMNSTFERWKNCCNAAVECCDTMILSYTVENFLSTCDNHWDGSRCYQDTLPFNSVKKLCPYQKIKNENSKCHHLSTKQCLQNGTWDATDYSQCFEHERVQTNTIWLISILGLSLLISLSTVGLHFVRKQQKSISLTLIVWLIILVTCRNTLNLISNSIILISPKTIEQDSWPCKLTSSFTQFSETFEFIYLALMAKTFMQIVNNKFNGISYVGLALGIIITTVTTITWSLIMQFTVSSKCWHVNLEYKQHWINDGLRFVLLLIAVFYFVRLLCKSNDEVRKVPEQTTEVKFATKLIIIFCLPFFTMPFILLVIETCFGPCALEETVKFLIVSFQTMQAISFCFVYLSHTKVNEIFKNITKKVPSNGSDASLAPSGISQSDENEPIKSWNDFVIRARNSLCDGNLYSIEPSISSAPDPTALKSRISLINRPNTIYQQYDPKRRPIRDIMHRAKSTASKPSSSVVPQISKSVTPPLPKIIPNHILDDVQLFEFYYKNLNTVFINESPINSSGSVICDPQNSEIMQK